MHGSKSLVCRVDANFLPPPNEDEDEDGDEDEDEDEDEDGGTVFIDTP